MPATTMEMPLFLSRCSAWNPRFRFTSSLSFRKMPFRIISHGPFVEYNSLVYDFDTGGFSQLRIHKSSFYRSLYTCYRVKTLRPRPFIPPLRSSPLRLAAPCNPTRKNPSPPESPIHHTTARPAQAACLLLINDPRTPTTTTTTTTTIIVTVAYPPFLLFGAAVVLIGDIILYRSVITHRHPPKSCSSKAIPNDFNRRRKPKTTHVNDYMLIRSRPTTGRSRQRDAGQGCECRQIYRRDVDGEALEKVGERQDPELRDLHEIELPSPRGSTFLATVLLSIVRYSRVPIPRKDHAYRDSANYGNVGVVEKLRGTAVVLLNTLNMLRTVAHSYMAGR
ncbi:predicted protein [Histoplasma capsulatum G186AR]|uniref:Uncharacterized protein n=1 Tax=Ajellomyces capsulatus (strain G186AR / H82 / ATCC MYA-2454 / RMSCC 2432) TaxID=447093 RepID=C0NCK4_AJECG|nr:uncharacterized protein HCBG_00850 [Histoplasma capsulatum G186AR]EEH11395.1 predicted protein [Histoplasma capsulatum G186AR]